MQLVEDIMEIYNSYGYSTEVIVASIRSPMHMVRAALAGADICTIPFGVIQQLTKHPLTDIGIERFLKDWEKVPK
jgi:transaldolase